MVKDLSKLMLRSYNNEADNTVQTMRPYARDSAIKRLEKSRETVSKLGASLKITITQDYHAQRIEELRLTADMAINRTRSDPQTVEGPSSATYPARPPVLYSYTLSRSARFHAMNLSLTGVTLMRTSPCALNTNVAIANCAGDPACACATPVPTMCAACASVAAINTCRHRSVRAHRPVHPGTMTSASGKVAAAGYADPMAVVDRWMDEASGADGHRRNLTDQGINSNSMGYGHSQGSGCFSTLDVSDSGNMTGAPIPKLPIAAVRPPANNAAGGYVFYATWADAMGAPSSLSVVIDGACTAIARELGNDMLNATYKATATLAAADGGQHRGGRRWVRRRNALYRFTRPRGRTDDAT